MATHAHRPTGIELPRPLQAAWPLLALAALALLLEIDPRLPWLVGVLGGVCFISAGVVRGALARRELAAVRRAADRMILAEPGTDASPLIRWRCDELTGREERERVRDELERLLRQLDPGRLPSASPLRRVTARRHEDLLRALAQRLGDGEPVSPRGVLLARQLVRDPASPLYAEDGERMLARALTRALGALEP